MKKLILILCLALPLFAEDAPKPAAVPETPTTEQRVIAVIRQQRDSLSQSLLDSQAQLQLVAAENESLKKQLAEAHDKLAKATAPAAAKPAEPKPAEKK